jgi:hypothetical protein
MRVAPWPTPIASLPCCSSSPSSSSLAVSSSGQAGPGTPPRAHELGPSSGVRFYPWGGFSRCLRVGAYARLPRNIRAQASPDEIISTLGSPRVCRLRQFTSNDRRSLYLAHSLSVRKLTSIRVSRLHTQYTCPPIMYFYLMRISKSVSGHVSLPQTASLLGFRFCSVEEGRCRLPSHHLPYPFPQPLYASRCLHNDNMKALLAAPFSRQAPFLRYLECCAFNAPMKWAPFPSFVSQQYGVRPNRGRFRHYSPSHQQRNALFPLCNSSTARNPYSQLITYQPKSRN